LRDTIRPKTLIWLGFIVAIVVVCSLALLRTDAGAGVIAWARCAAQRVTADRAAYQACFDVEREQILEDRARRHGKLDE